jgi:heme exporter protein C
MLAPLLLMALAFKAYYVWVLLIRIRAEIAAGKIRAARLRATGSAVL